MSGSVFDSRACALGEGPLWHPERQQLFWFDILGKRLLSQAAEGSREWSFDDHVSAAGWVDRDTLLIASASALMRFSLVSGKCDEIIALEADNPVTRSNDGRADPWGGFWIGTMGHKAEPGAGAIYRFFRGELRQLYAPITISNSICFAPDRSCAYFSDTVTQKVMQQPLDPVTGWPSGDASVFLDLSARGLYPDGAVTDAKGTLWLACWGAGQILGFSPSGSEIAALSVPARQCTCPAFGGADLCTLFVTSATIDLPAELLAREPTNGVTFVLPAATPGLPEPQVKL